MEGLQRLKASLKLLCGRLQERPVAGYCAEIKLWPRDSAERCPVSASDHILQGANQDLVSSRLLQVGGSGGALHIDFPIALASPSAC